MLLNFSAFSDACEGSLALLQARQQTPETVLFATLSNELENLPGETILVLDDYHTIQDKVLKERPQVKYVRTGNSDSNAAVLKITSALGFKPYTADALRQVELQKVPEYLNSGRPAQ